MGRSENFKEIGRQQERARQARHTPLYENLAPTRYKEFVFALIEIEDTLTDQSESLGNQGQALDGYSALAAFRHLAQKAKKETQ